MWQNFVSFMVSFFLMFVPVGSFETAREDEEVLLNFSVISDTHIDANFPGGQLIWAKALKEMAGSSDPVDAIVHTGDITNYGDGESIARFFKLLDEYAPTDNWVIAAGNHDIGHSDDATNEEARQRIAAHIRAYTGIDTQNVYYSLEVNGYSFIVLSDQSEDNWDSFEIYQDQLDFLDKELEKATAEGKPAFVVMHEPVSGVNGVDTIWPDGVIDAEYADPMVAILEKYENVFYLSGHVHTGVNGEITEQVFGFSCVETRNGVHYVNLPTYTFVNRYGIPWGGLGFHFEVYENEVVIRTRNYNTSKWYEPYKFIIEIV